MNVRLPVDLLQSKLRNGQYRLVEAGLDLSDCFPSQPGMINDLLPGYDSASSNVVGIGDVELERVANLRRRVEGDFWEECRVIEEWLKDNDIEPPLGEWQKGIGEPLFRSLNRQVLAYRLWDYHAVPIRFKEGYVFRIWAPGNMQGEMPKIRVMRLDDFALAIAGKTAREAVESARQKRVLERWQMACFAGAFALFLCWAL